jgi:hypothetical protein
MKFRIPHIQPTASDESGSDVRIVRARHFGFACDAAGLIVAITAHPVAYGILATTSGRFFSNQATASRPSTTHSKVSQVGSKDSDCSRFAAYSTRSCRRSYPCRPSRESAIVVLAHPRWANSIMLGASASLNQGVASNSIQRILSAVWHVAWIVRFLRSPARAFPVPIESERRL